MARLSPTARRSYNNALRAELAEQTRERILDAVVKLISEDALDELSVPHVARIAGVSQATIYRHFPNRTALLDAVERQLTRHLAVPPFPQSAEELAERLPEQIRYYAQNAAFFRLASKRSALRDVRVHGQARRDRTAGELLRPLTEHLDPRQQNAVIALFRAVGGYDTFELMSQRFGVTPEEAGEVMQWASRVLLGDLKRGAARAAARKKTSTTKTRTKESKR